MRVAPYSRVAGGEEEGVEMQEQPNPKSTGGKSKRARGHTFAQAPANEDESVVEIARTPQGYPYKNPKPSMKPDWAKKGETRAQLRNCKRILDTGMDMSKDAEWHVDPFGAVDRYQIAVAGVFAIPKLLVLYPVLFILLAPATYLNHLYVLSLPVPLDAIDRGSRGFTVNCVFQFLLSLPAHVIICVNYMFDSFVMMVFGSLWCTLTGQWARYRRNLEVIRPHNNGPALHSCFADIVSCSAGMSYRQGWLEYQVAFTMMFLLNPWMKYWIGCNPFLFELGERFITQIGRSMADMDIADVDEAARKCISRAKHVPSNRDKVDDLFFVPYYPYPPKGRQWCIGMQHVDLTVNITHTTHCRGEFGNIFSLSTAAELPCYRVMLWYNNPLHPYTGYVEANLSNGQPSQPAKLLGGEHPMWLVSGHNHMSSDRDFIGGVGRLDPFFDSFIPHIQRWIRGNVRGWEIAEEYFQNDPGMGYEALRLKAAAAKRKRKNNRT